MKTQNTFFIKFTVYFLIISVLTALFCVFVCGSMKNGTSDVFEDDPKTADKMLTVVIDAGHGGEDGGASSAAGLYEKDVNLDISMMLYDMFTANGVNVVMTRTDDRLLYNRNIDFKGRKKMLDLAARLSIAEKTPDSIFLSIHMNAFTDPRYDGLQVWYSPNNEESEKIAKLIQDGAKILQPENNRKIKKAGSNIYLLHRSDSPSVLVECGFLSNPAEAKKLENREYRRQIAFVIFNSVMEYLTPGES